MPDEADLTNTSENESEIFVFPASFAQQRLWLVDQISPGKAVYNIPYHHQTRLRGPLNVAALTEAVQALLARHEPLRTTFTTEEGEIMQVIAPPRPIELPIIDIGSLPPAEREAEMQRLINAEARHLFDLAQGPLFYAKLLRLAPDDHVFIFMVHHIVVDGLSLAHMAEEIAALYTAFDAGQPNPLPELPLQYADFVIWQREWMQGEVRQAQLDYWLTQLQGELPVSELPTDYARPARQENNGDWLWLHLPPALISQLRAFSRQEGVSLYMTLLAGFKALVHRYSGQDDVIVSSPTANRTQPELEKLIAFFINPVVLRTHLGDDPSFRVYLQQVRKTALGAFAHQELPFEQLVEALQIPRDLSHHPIFQLGFTLQVPPVLIELPGLTSEAVTLNNGTARFDLMVELWETAEGGVSGRWEYDTDLFTAVSMNQLMRHYRQLLEAIVQEPDQPISQLPLLSPEEEEALLKGWNETAYAYDLETTLPALFEEQVARTPERIAVDFEGEQLSYAALNGRVNQLAHYLRGLGVGPEKIVGVCLERSLEMVIALYGVQKAGGAYCPLDPEYPLERLAFMVADTEADVLLTHSSLVPQLPPFAGEIICLDQVWGEKIAPQPTHNPNVPLRPDNMAYVIYTSGSTGRPKGVVNEHRGIVNRLLWMQRAFAFTEADRCLQKTPYSFDVSVWEFFWPLQTGGRLVVSKPEGHKDSGYLGDIIRAEQITMIHFVPAMLRMFLAEPNVAACTSLKKLFCSGEALPYELVAQAAQLLPNCEVHNLYGPTEAAVDVTWWPCQLNEAGRVPIGKPIDNTQIYVLDKRMRPVPVGVTGELYIGGVQVSRGYLKRPELNAKQFVPDPFSSDPQARLYKTGDAVRYLPDGNIEYLHRLDFQVKVRGFRIELGEIEAMMAGHTAVSQAIVTAQTWHGDKRLIAYYVPVDGAPAPTPADLRHHLRENLPDYMIPTQFIQLEQFPLTSSGKINRRALPTPQIAVVAEQSSYIPPASTAEQEMAEIWQQVLNVERISVTANFFELGGHSLLGTRVMSHLREKYDINPPLSLLFTMPTIRELTKGVESLRFALHSNAQGGEAGADEAEEWEAFEF